MTRTFRAQKAGLTRALKSGDPETVRAECARTVREWSETGAHNGTPNPRYAGMWPDDWARWQRALDDTYPIFTAPRLEELI